LATGLPVRMPGADDAMKRATLLFAMMRLLLASGLCAQDYGDDARGVARISVLGGDVSVRRGDSGEWIAAALNAPLVADDSLSTAPGARAEIQFDSANMLCVGSDAEVQLAGLESGRYNMQIAQGTVTFRVLRNSRADVELNTPSISIRPLSRGTYRITVADNGESVITVRSGEAEIYTPGGKERLGTGRTMLARGNPSDPEFQIVAEIARDGWDEWNTDRDRRLEQSQGYRYAGSTIYGVEDLDDYGTWVNVSSYGRVWRPAVAVGWSPYYDGRWIWIDYYGWTWVGYEPWGWAPYHYGRWFWDLSFGWCWWPGGFGVRHYWSPALVAFFGYGRGGPGSGFGYGRVGWVPLGPREPYHRWYGRDFYRGFRDGFGDRMGVRHEFDIRSNYMNARVPNGVAGMDAGAFGRGGRMDRVRGEDLGRAGLVQGMLPVVPGRESQRMSDRAVGRAVLRTTASERSFAGRTPVQARERLSFDDQRRGMEQGVRSAMGGRGEAKPGRQAQGAGPAAQDRGVSRAQETGGGAANWRRMGEGSGRTGSQAAAGSQTPAMRQSGNSGASDWRSFGSSPASSTAARPGRVSTDNNIGAQSRTVASGAADSEQSSFNGTGSNGGWSRFSNRTATQQGANGREAAQTSPQSQRSSQYNSERPVRSSTSSGSGSQPRSSSADSVGSSAGSQSWRGFGSGASGSSTRSSAPVYSSPNRSTGADYGVPSGSAGTVRSSRPTYSAPSQSMGSSRTFGGSPSSPRSPAPAYSSPSRPSGGSYGGAARSAGPSYSAPSQSKGSSRPSMGGSGGGAIRSAPGSSGASRSSAGGGGRTGRSR
jgi:hypothetical protein